jgi:DNA-binding NarL/FixJ family response regulator
MPKIAIIDDHELFRLGLVEILKKESSFHFIGEFKDFTSVKMLIPTIDVNLILIDISLEQENGFDAAKYIKNVRPSVKVIILTSHKEEFYIINAMESEIDGYMHKNINQQDLIFGINKVLKGEKYYSPEISSILINNIYNKPLKGIPYLTLKEKQVVINLMEGFSSKEISVKLNVSTRTIETHRANILKKFGLKNTTELIKNIIEHKIKF